jgi:hypothetical protein
MGNKILKYIEQYLDKIVIAVAAVIAVVIVFVFVLSSPQVDGVGLSALDESINRKVDALKQKLSSEPNDKIQYESQQKEFVALLKDSVDGNVNEKIYFPLPANKSGVPIEKYTYRVPQIGAIDKASLAVVKMAAFVPTEELSTTVTYGSAGKKLEDLDLVTVESSIDLKSLYAKFKESFAAKSFPPEKKKDQYATPVFAKVQLQRKTQQSDGNWSEWTDVPLTKVCYLKENLELPKETSEYAMEMAMVQFAKSEFRNEIVQPAVYCNAIPTDQWISPSFYKSRQTKLDKQEEERRKAEAEAAKSQKLQNRSTPARETRDVRTPANEGPGGMPGMGGGGGRGTTSRREPTRTPTTTTRRTTTPTERTPRTPTTTTTTDTTSQLTENTDFGAIKLYSETNIDAMDKLVFWAHDDTAKAGEKYQYRIRIGVFNPIAGRDMFVESEKDYREQVVLWSDYAEAGETVEIPQRLYFFATNYREIDKGTSTDKTVEVMVARYMLGNWVSKKYANIKCGEEIGKADEQPDSRLVNAGISTDTIDLSTGAVMVDAQKVPAAGSRTTEYCEMLYSYDGSTILRTSIKDKNWPAKVQQVYKEINAAIADAPVVLLAWEQASSGIENRSPVNQPDTTEPGTNRGMPGAEPGMPGMPGGPGMLPLQ